MKKRINPAILVETFNEFEKQVDVLLSITNEFDLDLIDWKRADKKTLPAVEAIELNRFVRVNCDIMMDDPRETVDILIKSKFPKRIIVNLESKYPVKPLLEKIKAANFEAGVSMNPECKPQDTVQYFPYCDLIQIMTIEPGRQGNPFIESRLSVSLELRDLGFDGLIEVDGSINESTIPIVKKFPIDVLSVGSALSKAVDPVAKYKELENLLVS